MLEGCLSVEKRLRLGKRAYDGSDTYLLFTEEQLVCPTGYRIRFDLMILTSMLRCHKVDHCVGHHHKLLGLLGELKFEDVGLLGLTESLESKELSSCCCITHLGMKQMEE